MKQAARAAIVVFLTPMILIMGALEALILAYNGERLPFDADKE